jgi:hypothetical protein
MDVATPSGVARGLLRRQIMDARIVLTLIVGLVASNVTAVATAAPEADEARLIAVMEKMDAASVRLVALENALLSNQAEIGAAIGAVLASEAGVSGDLVVGREAEFGRAVTNLVRTFQIESSYAHRANDALVKRDLEWLEYLHTKGLIEDAVRHDIAIKTPLFVRRAEWIKKTGNYALALDSMTDASCFRDMVVVDGFQKTAMQLTYVSPYKEVLDAGTKRGMFTITEQEIHEQFTVPTLKGYGEVLGVEVDVSPWNEERLITISIVPPDVSKAPLQAVAETQE